MPLTDREIKNTKTDSKDIFLNDGRGLYLRVRASGQKIWLYRYKVGNQTKWPELGLYPSMSLSEARGEAVKAKSIRDAGEDPVEFKKSALKKINHEKHLYNNSITLSKIFETLFCLVISKIADDGAPVKRMFEKDVLPSIGNKKADEVTRRDITDILDNILDRDAKRMANMTLTLLKQMFAFAFIREMIKVDPTYLLKKKDFGGTETVRERALSKDEIIELHQKILSANLYLPSSFALYIILATSCRIGELIKALWENVDLKEKTWFIPAKDSKNKIEHTIYLSDFAVIYFEKLFQLKTTNTWLYSNYDGDGHVDTRAITKQVHDRQLSGSETSLDGRSKNFDSLALAGGKWTPHDLRRTSATVMVSLGISPDVIERCLNHAEENKMKKTYQRYDYADEQKAAWKMLGEHLSKLLD
jgi:integrase